MESTCTRPGRRIGWDSLRTLLVAGALLFSSASLTGCAALSTLPGNDTLASDAASPIAFPLPTQSPASPSIETNRDDIELVAKATTDSSDRYIARQFPNNYGAPPATYGVPSTYSVQPTSPATAPQPGFAGPQGFASPPTYTSPPAYTPPTNAPQSGFGPPAQPTYSAPPQYGTPSPYGDPGLTSAPGLPEVTPGFDTFSNTAGLQPPLLPELRTADLIINGYPARCSVEP
jgi:hypothetical protein